MVCVQPESRRRRRSSASAAALVPAGASSSPAEDLSSMSTRGGAAKNNSIAVLPRRPSCLVVMLSIIVCATCTGPTASASSMYRQPPPSSSRAGSSRFTDDDDSAAADDLFGQFMLPASFDSVDTDDDADDIPALLDDPIAAAPSRDAGGGGRGGAKDDSFGDFFLPSGGRPLGGGGDDGNSAKGTPATPAVGQQAKRNDEPPPIASSSALRAGGDAVGSSSRDIGINPGSAAEMPRQKQEDRGDFYKSKDDWWKDPLACFDDEDDELSEGGQREAEETDYVFAGDPLPAGDAASLDEKPRTGISENQEPLAKDQQQPQELKEGGENEPFVYDYMNIAPDAPAKEEKQQQGDKAPDQQQEVSGEIKAEAAEEEAKERSVPDVPPPSTGTAPDVSGTTASKTIVEEARNEQQEEKEEPPTADSQKDEPVQVREDPEDEVESPSIIEAPPPVKKANWSKPKSAYGSGRRSNGAGSSGLVFATAATTSLLPKKLLGMFNFSPVISSPLSMLAMAFVARRLVSSLWQDRMSGWFRSFGTTTARGGSMAKARRREDYRQGGPSGPESAPRRDADGGRRGLPKDRFYNHGDDADLFSDLDDSSYDVASSSNSEEVVEDSGVDSFEYELDNEAGMMSDDSDEPSSVQPRPKRPSAATMSSPTDIASPPMMHGIQLPAGHGEGGGFFARIFSSHKMPSSRQLMEQLTAMSERYHQAQQSKSAVETEYERTSWELQEAQNELSSLKQTTRYLQAQLRDNEEMIERVVKTERRKAKEELARLKEAMVKVVEREREAMRIEFLKQASELQDKMAPTLLPSTSPPSSASASTSKSPPPLPSPMHQVSTDDEEQLYDLDDTN